MKACFFDLDGTLIDSIDLIVRCFQHATETHLGAPVDREAVLSLIGRPLRPELERLAPGKGSLLTETYREMQFRLHDELVKPFPFVAGLVKTLAELPIPVGIVTSKARAGTLRALEMFQETAELFHPIITVEDCEAHKPDPAPLLLAARTVGCAPDDAAYVGDTIFDMQAALAAGMLPVGVTWGVATEDALGKYTPHVFHDISGLEAFLTATARPSRITPRARFDTEE